MKEWFVFLKMYRTIIDETVKQNLTTEKDELEWYKGLIDYALTGVEPTFTGICSVLWLAVKPIIDISKTGKPLGEEKKEKPKVKERVEQKEGERSSPTFLKEVASMWNAICTPKLPGILDIVGTRRDKLRLRLNEACGNKTREEQMEWLRELFKKVAQVPFLRGENNTGWKANFDWLVANDYNWKKVMEGKYDGKPNQGYDNGVILHNDLHKWDGITEGNFWDS